MSDKIRILSRVCCDFRLPDGGKFVIGPKQLLKLTDAPAAIRQDVLFHDLIRDGCLEVSNVTADRKLLENAPDLGVMPDGKKPRRKPETAESGKTEKADKVEKPV